MEHTHWLYLSIPGDLLHAVSMNDPSHSHVHGSIDLRNSIQFDTQNGTTHKYYVHCILWCILSFVIRNLSLSSTIKIKSTLHFMYANNALKHYTLPSWLDILSSLFTQTTCHCSNYRAWLPDPAQWPRGKATRGWHARFATAIPDRTNRCVFAPLYILLVLKKNLNCVDISIAIPCTILKLLERKTIWELHSSSNVSANCKHCKGSLTFRV